MTRLFGMSAAEPIERLAKVLARAGVGSRRDVEALIREGRVIVNGITVPLGTLYHPGQSVWIDGVPVTLEETAPRLWKFHKTTGVLVTAHDPQGRPTIYDALPASLPRVISVGRLDFNSEGLLLLTTHGALARFLELPATGWVRRYRVRVHGIVDARRLASLQEGIRIDGFDYDCIEASLERQQGHNAWIQMSLREGKNREIRRVMEYLGYPVTRLIRTSFGGFQLGTLPGGALEEVSLPVLQQMIGKAGWASVQVSPPVH
jgi:23S rRNA pseudouridine2605 synthase